MTKQSNKKQDIDAIIQRAVKAGLAAGRSQAEQTTKDAYRATERKLYALPLLIKRVEDNRQRLVELEQSGTPERSKDILRFSRTGIRLTTEEKLDALKTDIKAQIAADEYEIETIKKALKNIEGDHYYLSVKGRYIDGMSDEEIGAEIPCDQSTVRRNRGRLVRVLAVLLYGAQAI